MSVPDPAGPSRMRLLAPLRQRDFALLWTGMTVSLLGDGIYFVAIAWQAYALSNAPTALSLVGAAWTLPTVIFLLVGGAVSDRLEPRFVLLVASAVEALAISAIGVLSFTGGLALWMLLVLVAVYGVGEAFFNPAFSAIVPNLVEAEEFTAASALDQFVRPLAVQLVGPAVGGVLVALLRPGRRSSSTPVRSWWRWGRCHACAGCRVSPRRPGQRARRCARSARGSRSCAASRGCGARSRRRV